MLLFVLKCKEHAVRVFSRAYVTNIYLVSFREVKSTSHTMSCVQGISGNAHYDPTAERPGKDRPTPVNVNMSAPGATLALGLIYLKSNNVHVANR